MNNMWSKDSTLVKKKIFLIVILSIAGFILAYILANPIEFNICKEKYTWGKDYIGCLDTEYDGWAAGLFAFSVLCFIFSILLIFFREKIFNTWFRFSLFYVPIGILVIGTASQDGGGSWGIAFPSPGEIFSVLIPGLFFLISLIIIARGWWKTRKIM